MKCLGYVTSTRTMANAHKNHMVDVTADKNIIWLLGKEGEVMHMDQLAQDRGPVADCYEH